MSFNLDLNKQVQEVNFTRISKDICNLSLTFNNLKVFQSTTQKHLGLILDNRLSLKEYLAAMGANVSKTIAL